MSELHSSPHDLTFLPSYSQNARSPGDALAMAPEEGRGPGQGGDKYDLIVENPFLSVRQQPLSTFAIDVDTASFGMLLRDSQHKGDATLDTVLEIAAEGVAGDQSGYRDEFLALVRRAREIGR